MSEGILSLVWDARTARKQGPAALARRQRARLAEMVTFARTNSPYYRELYRHVPQQIEDPSLLPITSKKQLMLHFDDWVTDRQVTIERVRAFVDNPALIGERLLGKYTVATTSGTTGIPGIFVLDDWTLAVTAAISYRLMSDWLRVGDVLKILRAGARMAMIVATGGHFAGIVMGTRLAKRRPKSVQVLGAQLPLPQIVAQLNRFRPAILAPYASVGALLACEQEVGRLDISPALVVLSAEGLPLDEYDRISKALQAKVRHSYAATECTFLSYSCAHGWLHVNTDWLVLEPVDADYRPVPPGVPSHTALISNLANKVQPILRYDLGDSILQRPDLCPCGNPLPAIRVQGRTADVLTFPVESGQRVAIPPLALEIDHIPGIELFQIVQTTPTNLRVRLRAAPERDRGELWQAVHSHLTRLLAEHGLGHVTIERAEEAPAQSTGGKYRVVIPLN